MKKCSPLSFYVRSVAAAALLSGCAPTLYVVDRPILLEEQAAGEWPDLEKESESQAASHKPVQLMPQQMERGGERVLQTLEGEPSISPVKAPTKPDPKAKK